MSVHEKTTPAGTRRYVVRWREGDRNRSRAFARRRDAEAYDAEVERRRQLGPVAVQQLDSGRQTLDAYVGEEWGPAHAPTLAAKTRQTYAASYGHHVGPFLGSVPLREITPSRVRAWQAARLRDGAGPHAVRTAVMLLGVILEAAMQEEKIAANPVRKVPKPKVPRRAEVQPLAPSSVEAIRDAMRADEHTGDRDAALVAVLAYAGLRPGEALALRWRDVRENTLLVERAVSLGEVKSTKTGSTRTVRMLDSLRRDLAEWRMANGRPAVDALVFPAHDGGVWSDDDWRNWRRRRFAPALKAAELPHARPYDLRHSFASLLLAEGRNVIYVARQLGHDATLTLKVYGHVMGELEDAARLDADAEIRAARGESVPSQFPRAV